MKHKILGLALMTAVAMPVAVAPQAAFAKKHYSKTYKSQPRSYRYRCKRSSGTTGLVAGAAGGGLVANALGGGTVGTILGAAGGGLLGRHLDKKHDAAQNRRNGC